MKKMNDFFIGSFVTKMLLIVRGRSKAAFALVMVAFLLMTNGCISTAYGEDVKYVVNDSFDSAQGNNMLSQWAITPIDKENGNYAEVAADPENADNQCLKLTRKTANIVAYKKFPAVFGKVNIEQRIRFDNLTDSISQFPYVRNANDENLVLLMFTQKALIVKSGRDNKTIKGITFEKNVWYNIRIVIDTDTDKYELYVNDNRIFTSTTFNSAKDGVAGLRYEARWTNHYIDDLKVYGDRVAEVPKDDTTIRSDIFFIDNDTIKDIGFGDSVKEVSDALGIPLGASLKIYSQDGITEKTDGDVNNGDKIILTAADGITKKTFTFITRKDWIMSRQLSQLMEQAVALRVDYSDAYVHKTKSKIDAQNQEVKPIILDGRTLVPVRFISESFNAAVTWDEQTSTVTIQSAGNHIQFILNEKEYEINGEGHTLDVPAQEYNGRTMIPLRALVEALGKKVYWDNRGLIFISDLDNPFNSVPKQGWVDELLNQFTE